MVSQNDLIQRRAAAKRARATGTVPVVEDALVDTPEPLAPVLQARTDRKIALPVATVDRARVLTERDIVMPKLKIAQGLSKVVQNQQVKLGHWYHTTRNEDLGTEILFVPVDMRMSRSLWMVGQGVLCRSFDMVQGEGTPGILCEGDEDEMYSMPERERGCEYRLWTKDESTGRSKKPPCGINYNYLGLVLMDGTPEGRVSRAILTFRGTASRTAKDINSLVVDYSLNPNLPEWDRSTIRLRLESRSNSYGTFAVPAYEYVGATDERLLPAIEALRSMSNPGVYRATAEADPDDD